MTLQEIKERIAAYESKWGKLGHTNIMKPENEIQHSSLNERRNTMIKTTNDFYKFRQKVAIGKEANKLAHKATISPEELNERNFQNQIENNTLIHAGKNFKYVAKEDINGKPRYFYTQEEYDAFKNNGNMAGNAGDMAGKLMKSAANDVLKPENDRSKSVENYNNNARASLVNGIVEVSKNGGSKAAADAMKDNPDYKLYMQMVQHAIDNGVDPQEHTVNETGKLLGKDYADAIKDAENNLKEYFDAVPGLSNDLSVIALDELNELRKKNKKETVLESVGDKLGEDLSKGIAKSNIGEAVTKKVKHSAFDEEDETSSYKTAADLRQEREESIMSEYRAFKARANKGAEKNRLSHSAVISPRDLNARYEEELAKEYIAIHPENDDFESLSHAGQNYKYYAKVDLGNGNSRYFYTKEEYDAYNQPKKTTTTLVADKKPHNNGSLEATKKYHQEKAKEAKEAPFRNAAKTAGKELDMERALDKAWDNAEDSIKDKVKSRTKAMKDLADKYDVNHPFAKGFNNKLEEIKNNWNKKINDEAAKIEEKYGRENIWQNEEAQNFAKDVYSKGFKELEDALNSELTKQEASYQALVNAGKAWQKFDIAWDEIKELSKYDKQVLAEEMGLDSFDEEDILKKYYIVEDDKAWREAHANDEDYGKAEFEKEAQGLTDFWNDYKAAKKSLGHSAFNDEDDENSLSHNSNGYGGAYLHKIDDFYGPGKPRYFYSEADWNAYQEGLKRNNYNADKEAEAKQAKTDKQKADLARRSGMENYTKYQENKKADEEADARQAKIDEQKTRAKQKAGMEGYEEWNEKRQAEKEANAKKVAEDRNDMSGYAAWKRRRDYINNQKKASEAADAAEAEKHEIERKAVKNSVEVTKNKAAAKAQEDAESAKRKEEERAANAKKDAASKEAAMKAGQKSTMQEAENAARDKEHKADKEKAKWNNLNNNVTSILEKASKKYDNQLEALNREYESIKDKSSPEAKAIKDKISQTNTKKDAELDKEIMTVVKDLGEIFNDLEDKNGPEAKLLKAQARRALDYSSNTKLAKVMGETNSWLNEGMKHPKEV